MKSSRPMDAVLIILALAGALPVMLAELSSGLENAGLAYAIYGLALLTGLVGAGRFRALRHAPILHGVMLLIVVAAVAISTVEIAARQVPVIALGHFVTLLCAAKFLDLNQPRDRVIVVVITILLMVIGAMVSGSVVFGLVLLLHLTLGVWWLIQFRLRIDEDAAWRATLERLSNSSGRTARLPTAPPGATPRVGSICMAYGTVLIVVVVLTFLLVPRDLLRTHIPIGVPAGVSGFSAEVGLTELNPIIESDQPVMRVRLRRGGTTLGGEDRPLYLRGVSLELDSTARSFRTSNREPETRQLHHGMMQELSSWTRRVPAADMLETEVWIEQADSNEPYLFTLYPVTGLICPDIERVEWDAVDRSLKVEQAKANLHYRAFAPANLTADINRTLDAEADEVLSIAAQQQAILSLQIFRPGRRGRRSQRQDPVIPPNIVALARRITGAGDNKIPPDRQGEAASAIEHYLRSAVFKYSLTPRSLRGARNPIETFLLETREGYCQHFASAMTMLCKSVGVEARMVIGYLGTEYNAVGQFYRVRKRDAHAWVEVHLPERGWVVFDPTPLSNGSNNRQRQQWLAAINKWYDYIQFQWASLVVTFDAEHRRELLATFTRWWAQSAQQRDTGKGWAETIGTMLWGPPIFTTFQRMLYWLCVGLIITLVVLILRALWVVWLILREHMPRRTRGQTFKRHPTARFYDRLLVQLGRRGMVKPPALTPLEFAEQLVAQRPEMGPVRQMTEWFYAAQFGGQALPIEIHRKIGRWLENLRHYGRFEPGSSGEPSVSTASA